MASRKTPSPKGHPKWRKKYGGADVSAIKRLRDLELENARLKRILAERDLEIDVIKEILGKK